MSGPSQMIVAQDTSLAKDGFKILPGFIDHRQCDGLAIELTPGPGTTAAGHRNLLRISASVRQLATAQRTLQALSELLGYDVFPIRGLFFDKTPDANWRVPWHQDVSIAVEARVEVDGFGPWSVKEGIPHVQPPIQILESMIAVRIHLDDCGLGNGPLKVLPGTHRNGRLSSEEIQRHRDSTEAVECTLQKGDALLMKPLLLHASSPSDTPSHRRVIHIEYAADALPGGLKWYDWSQAA
ncbi:MAG TPA: phytanoyl-CoA dioxygenase family protein [Roseimicrobium sp.]|nr:phytanoyl-CoA dioxygenase family protein [Roseimicrobium sp.]